MQILLFVMQSAALCILFTVILLLFSSKDPVKMILNYPPAVRERVAGLVQYKDSMAQIKKKHGAAKALSGLVIALLLAILLWFSDYRTFIYGFFHAFGLFFIVNLYDLLILDWLWFCHSKKVRIPGTEDMKEAYSDKMFHFIGFLKGIGIGLLVSAVAAGLTVLAAEVFAK